MRFVEGCAAKIVVPQGYRDVQVFDESLPGFGIRKFASGKAFYFVKYAIGSQQRKLSLGPVVPGVLGEKRRRASEILTRARIGQDVVAEKRSSRKGGSATLRDLIPEYLSARVTELRQATYRETDRYLRQYWKPLHLHRADRLERRDIVAALDAIADAHGKVSADRGRVALSGFYAWAIDRGHADTNPVHSISRRAQADPGTRVLTEDELIAVWSACADDDFGRIVRLLILTGQRKTEIGDLSWTEVDLQARYIQLPPERTKNGRAHIVPLSDQACAILLAAPRIEMREHVFGEGSRGFQGWSKAKLRLDARIAAARQESHLAPLAPWTLHDIRRSVVTHLHEARPGQHQAIASPHVVEAIVNHVSGHRGGVAGVYNRALYLHERVQALDLWGQHIADAARHP